MILQNTTEIRIVGVYDRGIPNKERIVIEAHEHLNLAPYGIMLAFQMAGNPATPYHDNFLWLTERVVAPKTLIFVYTGPGEFRETTLPGSSSPALVMHWGRQYTILANSNVVPVLFRIDAVHIGEHPENVPQLNG